MDGFFGGPFGGRALTEKEKEEFQGMSWEEIEEEMDRREKEDLARQGVFLAPDHADQQIPCPPILLRKLALMEQGKKHPWEQVVEWGRKPKCTSANWSHKVVKFEVKAGVAYITLNRQDANNALNTEMEDALADAVLELHQRKDVRLVILKSEGKMFCAGGDPKSFYEAAQQNTEEQTRNAAMEFVLLLHHFQTLPQFTVALLQGSAMGTGAGLVSVCDMAIAVRSAFITFAEVKLGVVPATVAPFVVAKVGSANAKRIFCTAENCTAERAKEVGLVQEVVASADNFKEAVKNLADRLTLCAPDAVCAAKKLVMGVTAQPVTEELMNYTAKELIRVRKGQEADDGLKAVQARKKPYWADNAINATIG